MTLAEAIEFDQSPDTPEGVLTWRFTGIAMPGSRVDLCCSVCGERVSLDPTSQTMVANGAPVFCWNRCYPLINPEAAEWLKEQISATVSDRVDRHVERMVEDGVPSFKIKRGAG